MPKKKITREDFAGLRPAEGKRVDRMSAQGYDGYNPYGYNPEEYGYIKDGGTLPEVTVYGYYDSGDDGGGWSSGIPPWGDTAIPSLTGNIPEMRVTYGSKSTGKTIITTTVLIMMCMIRKREEV